MECDFKSVRCAQILQSATVVFTFLLPQIMPLVTCILSKSLSSGCRVISYIFDLSRTKTHKEERASLEITKWPYPIMMMQMEWTEREGIVCEKLHPDLKAKFSSKSNGRCYLRIVNGVSTNKLVQNYYEFLKFKRYLHGILSDYHLYKKPFTLSIEYIGYNDEDLKESDYELVKPQKVVEVVRRFKNGSEMRSDLKVYRFPLCEQDYGWKKPQASSRLFHAK